MRRLNTVSLDDCDWWELVQLVAVRSALQHLTPEEERALWEYADSEKQTAQQRRLAEGALAKVRQLLNLEP
jgi:hypothetical protein